MPTNKRKKNVQYCLHVCLVFFFLFSINFSPKANKHLYFCFHISGSVKNATNSKRNFSWKLSTFIVYTKISYSWERNISQLHFPTHSPSNTNVYIKSLLALLYNKDTFRLYNLVNWSPTSGPASITDDQR